MFWGLQKSLKRSIKLYVVFIKVMEAARFPRIIAKCAGRKLLFDIYRNK